MGAYIINIPSAVDRIIYVVVESDGKTEIATRSVSSLQPYTEPDMEQVRKEAYDNGYETAKHECEDCPKQAYTDALRMESYQKGLSDAWDAARKIGSNSMCSLKEIGFDFSRCAVADYNPSWFVVKNYSASECIEKIRQYEQEKEEQIIKGDIVLIKSTPEVEILVTYADEEYVSGIAFTEVDDYCEIGDQYTNIRISNVEKTGKHYDIVSVLQKMKES